MSEQSHPILLTAAQLQLLIQKNTAASLLIIDLSSEANYRAGHVPGACWLDHTALISGEKPASGKLPPLASLQDCLGQLGFDGSQYIVAYDDQGGPWAGRLIWTLHLLGFEQASYLDGGLVAWQEASYAISLEPTKPSLAVCPELALQGDVLATQDDILASLEQDDFIVWDARSGAEYSGEKVLAARGGHIPGAVHYEWTNLHQPGSQKLRDLHEIQADLNALGLRADKQIVTHCQTHRRSGLTYLVAKALGYPAIKAYPGSWSEWGNIEYTPITTGEQP